MLGKKKVQILPYTMTRKSRFTVDSSLACLIGEEGGKPLNLQDVRALRVQTKRKSSHAPVQTFTVLKATVHLHY